MNVGFVGTELSTIDYDEHISLVIYTQGCNFRCHYCHSPSLSLGTEESITKEEILESIKQHARFIESIVITGGEPTLLPPDDLIEVCNYAKDLELMVKIDTNGTNPDVIEKLLEKNLVDKVALDIKTYKNAFEYGKIIDGNAILKPILWEIERTMKIVAKHKNCVLECRTTIVPTLVGEPNDIIKICEWIKPYADEYYIQNFRNKTTLSPQFKNVAPYAIDHILSLEDVIRAHLPDTKAGIRF